MAFIAVIRPSFADVENRDSRSNRSGVFIRVTFPRTFYCRVPATVLYADQSRSPGGKFVTLFAVASKKVLLVSYLFPPAGGVGVQRALSFLKYLPESGCAVTVLAARNPSTPVRDPGLLRQIPAGARIERVFTPELPFSFRDKLWRALSGLRRGKPASGAGSVKKDLTGPALWLRRLLTPDPQVVWTPFAVRRASAIIEKQGIHAVLVTVPPFSALRVGVELKRRFPNLKLISDFRDEWLSFYLNLEPGTRSPMRAQAEEMERECVEMSDYVVAVTPAQRGVIRARYPEQPDEKFLCIPNGYDPAVFSSFRSRPHGTERLVISLFGTVYHGYNSPWPLIEACDRLPEPLARQVEMRFFGRVEQGQERPLTSRFGTVKPMGFFPYEEALHLLEETDFLLLPVDSPTAHAGKLFEYLATGKPILALTPPHGEVARIIRETASGWSADPKDPAAVDAMLREALDTVRAGRFRPDREAIRAFERPRLAGQLARATGLSG
jgi:glycosyltransferase involved in cell wall biosynthesis